MVYNSQINKKNPTKKKPHRAASPAIVSASAPPWRRICFHGTWDRVCAGQNTCRCTCGGGARSTNLRLHKYNLSGKRPFGRRRQWPTTMSPRPFALMRFGQCGKASALSSRTLVTMPLPRFSHKAICAMIFISAAVGMGACSDLPRQRWRESPSDACRAIGQAAGLSFPMNSTINCRKPVPSQ